MPDRVVRIRRILIGKAILTKLAKVRIREGTGVRSYCKVTRQDLAIRIIHADMPASLSYGKGIYKKEIL